METTIYAEGASAELTLEACSNISSESLAFGMPLAKLHVSLLLLPGRSPHTWIQKASLQLIIFVTRSKQPSTAIMNGLPPISSTSQLLTITGSRLWITGHYDGCALGTSPQNCCCLCMLRVMQQGI